MYEQLHNKVTCPTCKNEIYPEEAAKFEYLCGDILCIPTKTKSSKLMNCDIYYFCSNGCHQKFFRSACPNISRLNHILNNISRTNEKQFGIKKLKTYLLSKIT